LISRLYLQPSPWFSGCKASNRIRKPDRYIKKRKGMKMKISLVAKANKYRFLPSILASVLIGVSSVAHAGWLEDQWNRTVNAGHDVLTGGGAGRQRDFDACVQHRNEEIAQMNPKWSII
jgi:hypothetical protein